MGVPKFKLVQTGGGALRRGPPIVGKRGRRSVHAPRRGRKTVGGPSPGPRQESAAVAAGKRARRDRHRATRAEALRRDALTGHYDPLKHGIGDAQELPGVTRATVAQLEADKVARDRRAAVHDIRVANEAQGQLTRALLEEVRDRLPAPGPGLGARIGAMITGKKPAGGKSKGASSKKPGGAPTSSPGTGVASAPSGPAKSGGSKTKRTGAAAKAPPPTTVVAPVKGTPVKKAKAPAKGTPVKGPGPAAGTSSPGLFSRLKDAMSPGKPKSGPSTAPATPGSPSPRRTRKGTLLTPGAGKGTSIGGSGFSGGGLTPDAKKAARIKMRLNKAMARAEVGDFAGANRMLQLAMAGSKTLQVQRYIQRLARDAGAA